MVTPSRVSERYLIKGRRVDRFVLDRIVSALLLVFFGSGSAEAFELYELDLPVGTATYWVAQDLEQNGLPMQIQTLSSELEPAAVLDHFRTLWSSNAQGDAPATLDSKIGDWLAVSTWIDELHVVVQVRPSTVSHPETAHSGLQTHAGRSYRTEGYVSLLNPQESNVSSIERMYRSARVDVHDLPVPDNSVVLSVSRSRDVMAAATTAPLVSTTVLIDSALGLQSGKEFYLRSMSGRGWRLVADSSVYEVPDSGVSLLFDRNGGTCEVAIQRTLDGSSLVVLNRIDTKRVKSW